MCGKSDRFLFSSGSCLIEILLSTVRSLLDDLEFALLGLMLSDILLQRQISRMHLTI